MNGIICDIEFTRHRSLITYYYAIRNLYGEPKIIKGVEDLDIDTLFIGDDHFQSHRDIWEKPGFIESCNEKNVKVIVFNNERIFNSYFPWNEDIYKNIRRFKKLYYFHCDIDDVQILGLPINRLALSKNIYNEKWRKNKKRNNIVFIGRTDCVLNSYANRREFIDKIKKSLKLNIIEPTIEQWEDYMDKISGFRFVLCPLGNGNFITPKFYETLMVGSIPVQQVKENTLNYYPVERGLDDCIFFKDLQELEVKLLMFNLKSSHNLIFHEDIINELLKNII